MLHIIKRTAPLKFFLSYYGPHKHLFFLDMFCALVICLIDLAFPYLSRSALNHLLPQQEYRVFYLLIGFFAVAYVGKGLLYFVVSYWGHVFGVRVEADLRRDLYSHMESLSFSFLIKTAPGSSCLGSPMICLKSQNWPTMGRKTSLFPLSLWWVRLVSCVPLSGSWLYSLLPLSRSFSSLHHLSAAENAPGQSEAEGPDSRDQRRH